MDESDHQRFLSWMGKHDEAIMLTLTAALVIALIFAVLGWNKAVNAQERVTSVETQLATEKLGKAIADVTTCFNQAMNRPRLLTILRGISVELEPDPRQQLSGLIDDYERDTPTNVDCIKLSRKTGIDPKPYINNPPSEAGNKEGR